MRKYVLFLTFLILGGCSPSLYMTYNCNPAGATLQEDNGGNLGSCPKTVHYDISKQDQQNGYMTLKGITANWVSGASVAVSSIHADLQNGDRQSFIFERPKDAPGYDVDARYALALTEAAGKQALCQQAGNAAMMAPSHTGSYSEGLANQQTAYVNCMMGIAPQPQQQPVIAVVPPQTCRAIGGSMVQCQ
jgi:hypothetical protein